PLLAENLAEILLTLRLDRVSSGALRKFGHVGQYFRLGQLPNDLQRDIDSPVLIRDVRDRLLLLDQFLAELRRKYDSRREVDIPVHVEPSIAEQVVIHRLHLDVVRRDSRVGEREAQTRQLDVGVRVAEQLGMILYDRIGNQLAHCRQVLHLPERLTANIDAHQLAVDERQLAAALQRRLHRVDTAGLPGDIDVPAERPANSP